MQKKALTPRPLSPEERLVASYMAGSGLYSGLQLKHHLMDDEPEHEDEVLKIKLPKDRLMHIAKTSEENGSHSLLGNLGHMLGKPMQIGAGGFAGFHHSSKLYEEMEHSHLKKELAKAEKEYLDMLGQVKTSEDKATPNVDAFVRGIVSLASSSPEEIEKEAKHEDDMADGSIKRMLGEAVSPLTAPFKPIVDTAKGVTAGTTLGSALAVYLLKQKLERAKQMPSSPSRIEIEPV